MLKASRKLVMLWTVVLGWGVPLTAFAEGFSLAPMKLAWVRAEANGPVEYLVNGASCGHGDDGLLQATARIKKANPCFVLVVFDPALGPTPAAGNAASQAFEDTVAGRSTGYVSRAEEPALVLLYDESSGQFFVEGAACKEDAVIRELKRLGKQGGALCSIVRQESSFKSGLPEHTQWHDVAESLESSGKINHRAFRIHWAR